MDPRKLGSETFRLRLRFCLSLFLWLAMGQKIHFSPKKNYLENVHSLASQVIISIDCFGALVEHYKGIFWTPGIQSIKKKKIKSIITCTSNAGNKNHLETHSRWPGKTQHSTKKEEIKLSSWPTNFLFS